MRLPPRLLILALALGLSACSSLTTDAPPVADSTMAHVLTDLHLVKARAEASGLPPGDTSRAAVLRRHQLTPAGFEEALAYYAEHPEEFEVVYDNVLNQLSEERSSTLQQSLE